MNKKLALAICSVFISSALFAQTDSVLKRSVNALENYAAAHPIEKVHLHLDRQVYFPGDTIWFESYVVIGPEHKLSALSGILYAELISPKDSVIKRLTLGLQNGTAPGDFELPYDLTPGNYRIRAYTNWMRNFGPEYFFDQLVVVSGFSTPPAVVAATNSPDKVDLQFFPEGGDLISGLRSKVAFKAINQNGMAEEVQGSISDGAGNEVATFNSQHLGMGVFPLEPETGKTYFAKVTAADGSKFSVPLPMAKPSGYTLTVNNSPGDSLYVKIAAKNVSDTAFYLLAQQDGRYDYAASGKVTDKPFTATIPKSKFSTGIVQFTLFSQSGEPENERIVFMQNDDQLHLTVSTDKQSYAPGEEVKLNIEAKDKNGKPAVGAFSVSVVDESKVPVNELSENTIFTDLLLKSEISGYVQDPNYYFIDPNEQTKADLDLLMLTQGYRRFEWRQMMKKDTGTLAYQPEKGFTISGTIKTLGGRVAAKGKVILSSMRNKIALDTNTDDMGRFAFYNLELPDTAKLTVNAKDENGSNKVSITIDKPNAGPAVTQFTALTGYITGHYFSPAQLDAQQVKQAYNTWRADSARHVIVLKEVKIKDKQIPPFHPDYEKLLKYSTNLNGPGNANQVIMADDGFLRYASLSDALSTRVHNVDIGRPPFGVAISLRAKNRDISGKPKPMAIYVNGMEAEPDYLNKINPADVYSVEVLYSATYVAIYGSEAANGAIIVTLKNGSERLLSVRREPGIIDLNFKGFYKARQFYAPKYASTHIVNLAVDRKTIFWSNAVQMSENGPQTLNYFNAGNKANYLVTMEGVDVNGKLAWQLLRYKVELNN